MTEPQSTMDDINTVEKVLRERMQSPYANQSDKARLALEALKRLENILVPF